MSADEHQVYCPSWKHLPPEDNADDCGDSETKSQRRTTVGHKTRPAGHTHTHTGPSDCTNSTPYRGMKVCHALCCSQISKQLIINGLDCLTHLTSYIYSDCFKSEFKLGALKKNSLNTLTLASHPAG